MRLLLDTHAYLWWVLDNPKLSPAALEAIADPAIVVHVSTASIWEISIKATLGPRNRSGRFPWLQTLDIDIQKWFKIYKWNTRIGFRAFKSSTPSIPATCKATSTPRCSAPSSTPRNGSSGELSRSRISQLFCAKTQRTLRGKSLRMSASFSASNST